MASSRGGSLSQWKLLMQLRNYLMKSYPSVTLESLQKDLNKILKFSSDAAKEEIHPTSNLQVSKDNETQIQKSKAGELTLELLHMHALIPISSIK